MSRKRQNFDDDDNYGDMLVRTLVPRLSIAGYIGVLATLWFCAFCVNARLNYVRGQFYAQLHINDANEYHESCVSREIIRREHPEKCLNAQIDKDLSLFWTSVDYTLKHTHVCIFVSCYAVTIDLIDKVGWLVIGLGVVGVLLLFVIGRVIGPPTLAAPTYVYETRGHEVQPWAKNDAKERGGELRLLEMKND